MITEHRYGTALIYFSAAVFIIINSWLMLKGLFYAPLAVLFLVALYAALFFPVRLFMSVVFLTPLSIELSSFYGHLPFDVSLPTEPLILMLLVVTLARFILSGVYDKRVLYHPVSVAIIFYLIWIFITTLTSSMPVVSVKYLLVRLWFILLFYFIAIDILKHGGKPGTFIWCYAGGLVIVVVYTFFSHAGYGLTATRVTHLAVRPFYNDHTAWGAALAMFIPVVAVFSVNGKHMRKYLLKGMKPAGLLTILILFCVALVLSYSRAAWLSIMAAFGVLMLIKLRVKVSTIIFFSVASVLLLFFLRDEISGELTSVKQDSSENLREHVRSIPNITSDVSNLERINRWNAAIAMFRERPLFGWGPGTYMFRYAPFQLSHNRTEISTNFGEVGDAHSEYLGPLAESGLPGMVSFIAVAGLTVLTGFRFLKRSAEKSDRLLVTGLLAGLVTYLVHGGLNNFLHSDKLAIPFWGFTAIIVALDIYSSSGQETRK